MDQRTEPIRQDIDAIRESMTDKIEQIETKIKGTVEDTRRMVDIKYQVSQRPWAALGVSLLVGYTLGSIGDDHKREQPQPQRSESFRSYTPHDDRVPLAREHDNDRSLIPNRHPRPRSRRRTSSRGPLGLPDFQTSRAAESPCIVGRDRVPRPTASSLA